jgi:hypothetical protein
MRWAAPVGVMALVFVGACTTNSGNKAQSPAPSPAGSASAAAPSASAKVSVQGHGPSTAAFTQPDVRCRFPDVDGPSIALLSTPPGLVFRIKVQPGKVTVLVSDDAMHERDFTGTGVATFDPSTGAQVDSSLTETPTTAGSPGDIGQLTSIKASVDCAGQDPGLSTLTLTGDTPQGSISHAPLETARVECNPSGAEVSVIGIVTINGAKQFMELGLRPEGVTVNKLIGNGSNHYEAPPGAATLTYTGAHVNGDAIGSGDAAAHTLHVEGDTTCGTPVG